MLSILWRLGLWSLSGVSVRANIGIGGISWTRVELSAGTANLVANLVGYGLVPSKLHKGNF